MKTNNFIKEKKNLFYGVAKESNQRRSRRSQMNIIIINTKGCHFETPSVMSRLNERLTGGFSPDYFIYLYDKPETNPT